jgi:hypothetical protein
MQFVSWYNKARKVKRTGEIDHETAELYRYGIRRLPQGVEVRAFFRHHGRNHPLG